MVLEMISLVEGEKPRELNWSSLAGTCGLLYYQVCMYMYVSDLADESLHSLSMWQHVLGACIKHSHEMETEHEVTAQQWQNRREEKKNIAMHCMEMNEVRSA